jgi:hypothetical protein
MYPLSLLNTCRGYFFDFSMCVCMCLIFFLRSSAKWSLKSSFIYIRFHHGKNHVCRMHFRFVWAFFFRLCSDQWFVNLNWNGFRRIKNEQQPNSQIIRYISYTAQERTYCNQMIFELRRWKFSLVHLRRFHT